MSGIYFYNDLEQISPRGKMGAAIKAIRKGVLFQSLMNTYLLTEYDLTDM